MNQVFTTRVGIRGDLASRSVRLLALASYLVLACGVASCVSQSPLIARASMPAQAKSYDGVVLADSPLAYWRLDEVSGTTLVDASGHGHDGTYAGEVTHQSPGALANDSDPATSFDGTSGNAQVGLDLSANSVVTVEFWSNWSGAPGDDRLALEYTDSTHAFFDTSGFLISPDSNWEQSFEVSMSNASGVRFSGGKFARPSNGAWHYYAIVFDRAAGSIKPYVDGALQPFTNTVTGSSPSTFGNLTLWLMSRHGTGLFGAGTLDEVAVYPSALTTDQISSHYAASGNAIQTSSPAPSISGAAGPTAQSALGAYDGHPLPPSTEVVNPLRGSYEWHDSQPEPPGWPVLDAYARLNWSDLEPTRDQYDFSSIDRALAKVQARQGKFGFEVVSAISSSGSIVPPYLMAQMPKGFWFNYGGKGKADTYAPDWNSPAFLDRAQALVNALASRYKDDPRLGWVEIGFYGNWGEWHTANFPYPAPTGATDITAQNANRIIDMYVKAFPGKRLIMTVGLHNDALRYALNVSPTMGWRTNCIGSPNMGLVNVPPDLLTILQNRWKTAPLLSEYCPNHSGSQTFQRALDQIPTFHVATIGNGNVDAWDSYSDQEHTYFIKDNLLAGYRYLLDHVGFPAHLPVGAALSFTSSWSNVGVTPTYDAWTVLYQLRDKDNNTVWQGTSQLDLQQLRPTTDGSGHDVPVVVTDTFSTSAVPAGQYDLSLSIVDPANYSAPLALAIDGRRGDGSYLLGQVSIDAPEPPDA